MSDIKSLTKKIKQFRDERDWKQFHNHKDLAVALVLEAAELLEHFQWKNLQEADQHAQENKQAISDELADIAMYLLELADNLRVDLSKAIEQKLKKNTIKYPVEKAKGKHTKYNNL
ncbi:MAG: nucleotide pyrophosphohydrolase [Candidatus Omnitrophica bacterium]|nr:nucleotide pyrophosphohydrolase [Candidatus Omnitrophota bacterium]